MLILAIGLSNLRGRLAIRDGRLLMESGDVLLLETGDLFDLE